jgi:mannose-6-phosphate isomerase-like protein (cupin superfamily)
MAPIGIPPRPHVVGPGDSECTEFLGHTFRFTAGAADTNGAFSLIEIVQRRGGEPPVHVHHREDEGFYLLVGTTTFYVGAEQLVATAGSFVFLPRGVPHSFTVDEDGEVRVLQLCSPPGLEEFFRAWGSRPLDVEAMAEALAPYGVELVGPPPQPSA